MELANLWQFELRHGASPNPREGACLLDAVSWLEYGRLGDQPECVCPVIAMYGRVVNDTLNHAHRQRLRPFIPRLIGTVDPSAKAARAEYLAWQAVRQFAAIGGDALGLPLQSSLRYATRKREVYWRVALLKLQQCFSSHQFRAVGGGSAYCAAKAVQVANRSTTPILSTGLAVMALVRARCEITQFERRKYEAHYNALADAMIATLDGVLLIGKQAEPIDVPRADTAVRQFAEKQHPLTECMTLD